VREAAYLEFAGHAILRSRATKLRKHPDIRKHVAIKSINALDEAQLLALVQKLGIDAKAIIDEATNDH
jgi:hypothetical protein